MPYTHRTCVRPARRGSVLVLVVALLVLLALVATAYLSTTRVDRYAARQYDSAVRLDLLAEGWLNVVFSATIDDLFDGEGNFRPATIANDDREQRDYENYDAPGIARYMVQSGTYQMNDPFPVRHGDEWLSSRVPWLNEPYAAIGAPTNNSTAIWTYISGSLLEDRFDTPYMDVTASTAGMTRSDSAFAARQNVFIGSIELAQDGIGTVAFPALTLTDPRTGRTAKVLAGDADGDGIADSALQRLTELNGITYFASYRVIDHNSAINVNTALASTSDFKGAGTLSTDIAYLRNTGAGYTMVSGFFPSHIGLMEILQSYNSTVAAPNLVNQSDELRKLNDYRFNTTFAAAPNTHRATGIEGNVGTNTAYPVSDEAYGTYTRTDMWFNSVGEALWMMLGRRPGNPGYNVAPDGVYRAFDVTSTAALAYRGGVVRNISASESDLEQMLDASVGTNSGIQSRAYRANSVVNWFNENYAIDLETPLDPTTFVAPRRTLLTATNATSNAVSSNSNGLNPPDQFLVPAVMGRYSGTHYMIGGGFNPRLEIDRSAEPNLPALVGAMNDVHKRPATKVDINTASFGDMWRGFWQVMSYPDLNINGNPRPFQGLNDGWGTPFTEATETDLQRRITGIGPISGSTHYDPYLGMKFARLFVTDPNEPLAQSFNLLTPNYWGPGGFVFSTTTFSAGFHPSRMFRSPLRSPPLAAASPNVDEYDAGTFRMAADQVVLLRSAIAAVNAEQARRHDDNLVVRTFIGYPRGAAGSLISDTVTVIQTGKAVSGYQEPPGNSFLVAGPPRTGLDPGTGGAGLLNQAVTVRVFGTARQPFITEVFVNTDNETDTNTLDANPAPNPRGYIAIELFNPYPFPIDISKCRVLTVNRTPRVPIDPTGLVVTDESQAVVLTDQIILDQARNPGINSNNATDAWGVGVGFLIVPPRGWLVLENYDVDGSTPLAALGRPNSSNLATLVTGTSGTASNATGPVPIVPGPVGSTNFVFIPNLDRLYNREFILARYTKATTASFVFAGYTGPVLQYSDVPAAALIPAPAPPPPWDVRDFAPLDSFDFTGIDTPLDAPPRLTTLPTAASTYNAANWHYNRACPSLVTANKEWRYVFPGRYDASQPWLGSVVQPATETGYPRQQGVRRASYDAPGTPDPWDPANGVGVPAATPNLLISLGQATTGLPDSTNASYAWDDPVVPAGTGSPKDKGEFTIPLGSLEAFRPNPGATLPVLTTNTMDWAHWPGMNPPIIPQRGTPPANWLNRYPYGGFARNLDVLQVPYIGSYWIQHSFDFHDGDIATRPHENAINPTVGTSTLSAPQPLPWGPLSTSSKRMIEINSVTMDSMFAEDTDTLNDPTIEQRAENAPVSPVDLSTVEDTRHTSKEQVGRFAPLRPSDELGNRMDLPDDPRYGLGSERPRYGDYWEDVPAWRYHWAKRIFEHFTVQSQDEDALAQANAQAYKFENAAPAPISTHGPRSPESIRNKPGTTAPKYTYAKVVATVPPGSGTVQIRVTNLPAWITNPSTITFVGGPHEGQRRVTTAIAAETTGANQPPRYRIVFSTTGTDPRPWDATAPILEGDTIRFDSAPEEPSGIEGLVNINTAPARVLATLPWFPSPLNEKASVSRIKWDAANKQLIPGAGDTIDDNWDLAQAIAWYRDRDDGRGAAVGTNVPGGPFASVFDLYQIPGFKFAQEQLIDVGPTPGTGDVGLLQGDFTYSEPPRTTGVVFPQSTDGIRFDFKEQYLLLNRVSNLITTRSDVFTIYVLVQGWRDVGLPNKPPQFVAERREAVIVDRTAITPNNRKLSEYRLTTD